MINALKPYFVSSNHAEYSLCGHEERCGLFEIRGHDANDEAGLSATMPSAIANRPPVIRFARSEIGL